MTKIFNRSPLPDLAIPAKDVTTLQLPASWRLGLQNLFDRIEL